MLMSAATPDNLRDIFEEPLFSEQMDALGVSYRHRDDIMSAISFVLARHPEIFPQVPNTCLSAVTVELYDGYPSVRFLFTFSEDRVTLVAIDFGERLPRPGRR